MNPIQKSVGVFVHQHGLETDVTHRLLDALSELGEVAKEVLNRTSYGSTRFLPKSGWKDELGDVFFSLICLANTTGVNVDDAVRRSLKKYARRLERTGDASSHVPKKRRRSSIRRNATV